MNRTDERHAADKAWWDALTPEAQRLYDEHANTDLHSGTADETYFAGCPTCNPDYWREDSDEG